MTNFGCGCRVNCAGLAIVASVIIGIITAFLQFSAIITVTPAFLWVLFGIAVVYLAVLLVSERLQGNGTCQCRCGVLPVLLAGILVTVLTAVILLAIPPTPASVLSALIVGVLLGAFSLTVTTTACLVKCAAGCEGNDDAVA